MEFKTRVGVGTLTGARETGGQFEWQERSRQREYESWQQGWQQ